ncbi:TolC family protein [Undibacterium sp. RTI2.1]|nr:MULTISPECIES: TolC family protein [unclassified Undibacterium]MEB0032749.1 TolC family protein [Undibacterium sp. RTI2.1]MEB0117972.1 TolC family protein [Undibacterium sp. RTI2.2]
MKKSLLYCGFRYPAEIISHVVWLYFRFALSFRDIEELMASRGIIAAEQTLAAANADIGQAKAQYFPSLKLTTGYGDESRSFKDLFDPASLLWMWALALHNQSSAPSRLARWCPVPKRAKRKPWHNMYKVCKARSATCMMRWSTRLLMSKFMRQVVVVSQR